MKKKPEAPMKKKYEKPKVTVTELQIEERLMACGKVTRNPCRWTPGGVRRS